MPPLIALIRSRRCGHHGIWPKRLLAWKAMGWPSSGGEMFSIFTLNYVARMFEFKPEWRNLWQHMGGNMPLEDMMVLPRLPGSKNPLLKNLFFV